MTEGLDAQEDYFDDAASDEDSDYLAIEDVDASDISDIESDEVRHEPIHRMNTERLRRLDSLQNSESIADKVRDVLSFMESRGINLVMFMDAISWGDEECISDAKIRFARTSLFTSEEFGPMMRRWWKPPGGRAKSGPSELKKFVIDRVGEMVEQEMKDIAPLLSPPRDADALSLKTLTGLNFRTLTEHLHSDDGAPVMWLLLRRAGWTDRQAEVNTHKTPNNVILNIIASLAFTRSHHRNRMATLWAIYLKSCGLSARAFDALHAIGLTMSSKWTTEAFADISDKAMDAARNALEENAYFLSYDNLNIPKRVFSMRTDHQNNFYSACAGTLWVLPDKPPLPPELSPKYQQIRREGAQKPFDYKVLMTRSPEVSKRIEAEEINVILRFLLDSPVFAAYDETDPILARPATVHQLPCGPDHVTQQFILRTADIEEASYDGNDKVIQEWLRQLKLDSLEEKKKTSTSRLIVIVGDQLTVERLRGLARYRHADINGFERMDWIITQFGWFHLVMAFANSIHKQYLGTSAGIGLQKAFDLLNRKGLHSTQTKGPFWHHLDEALHHIAEADILACWQVIGKVDKLEGLLSRLPEELYLLAQDIHEQYASRKALQMMVKRGEKDKDPVKYQSIMFNRDILAYLNIREAIRIGDVGRMEDLLPSLALRFAGGGNNKYLIEVLELMQGLKREWPTEVRDFVVEHCWLVNRTGKRDGFTATDQGQEQNIKDLKVTYRSSGPGATLENLAKISPAVPVFRAVKNCVKWQIREVLSRGDCHSAPDKKKDVEMYKNVAVNERWFEYEEGRTINRADDRVKDVMTEGTKVLFQDGALNQWWNSRSFERATKELWIEDERDSAR